MSPPHIHILVVDDEPDIGIQCKFYLERSEDMKVETVCSVAEAMASLAQRNYDAIVSDYQMPGEDGIQFLKSLRGKGDQIPFILFTGKGREEVVIEALNSGADSYLQKGGKPTPQYTELEHRIRAAVRKHRIDRSLALRNCELQKANDELAAAEQEMAAQLEEIRAGIDEMAESKEELWESEDESRALLMNLSTGVVVHALDTTILFSNPMASSLLGLTEDQIRGKAAIDPSWNFLREDGTPLPLAEYPVNRVLSSRQSFMGRVSLCRKPLDS